MERFTVFVEELKLAIIPNNAIRKNSSPLDPRQIDKKTAQQVGEDLKKIVPAKYWSLVDMAMDALDNVKADPQAILGKDNVRRLVAFFTGTQTGAIKCDLKDIPQES